ncbi:MAG: ABC transporter permease [Spirochaetales bacterium]|nr:ABC transporter permease [Spirochaetales bacterium]
MIKDIAVSLGIEILKIRKSMIFRITAGFSVFISLIMGMFMYFIMHPDILPPGLLKTKVNLATVAADWPSYFDFLLMLISAIGIILFGFIISWIFGREYADKTIKDILSLPASRTAIVLSKLIAAAIWCMLCYVLILLVSLGTGALIDLPLWSTKLLLDFIRTSFIITCLLLLLCPPTAYVASTGRGYLAPIGFVIICMGLANLFGNIGLGAYFPWTIPMLYSNAIEGPGSELSVVSYIILSLTCLAGITGTIVQWNYTDQH